MNRLSVGPNANTPTSDQDLSEKELLARKRLKQKVIARWENEGGAGPDARQEGVHATGALLKQPESISSGSWSLNLNSGAHVLIRPINKSDAHAERRFIEGLSSDAQRLRFMAQIPHPTDEFIAQLTELDGVTEVALVAVVKDGDAESIVGVSRYSLDSENGRCECALSVSADWHHNGIGTALMKHLIEIARSNKIAAMESTEYAENAAMRTLLQELGFHMRADPDDARFVIYTLLLSSKI